MKKNRLLKVAALIEVINPESFDMDSWSGKKNECGTTFCACGYAAHVGLIKGFNLEYDLTLYGKFDPTLKYKGYENWGAVEKVFGLSEDEAVFLFMGRESDTPSSVAERIRRFVETDGKFCQEEEVSFR